MYRFVIRGTRGTLPACGTDFLRYGGDTTCFSVETPEGLVIIDAGTGIRHVMRELADRAALPPTTVLLTHLHMDHLIGLPGFEPLFNPAARIRFMADPLRDENWRIALDAFMRKPYWPVGLSEVSSSLEFADLPTYVNSARIMGADISWIQVPHPQQCVAYRIATPAFDVVIATDIEIEPDADIDRFVEAWAGAGTLVIDAQYTPGEYELHRGWGHSTWESAVRVAEAAEIPNLVLTHHAPARKDAALDDIIGACRQRFPAATGSVTNMVVDNGGPHPPA